MRHFPIYKSANSSFIIITVNFIYCEKTLHLKKLKGLALLSLFALNLIMLKDTFSLNSTSSVVWPICTIFFSFVIAASLKKVSYTTWFCGLFLIFLFSLWLLFFSSGLSFTEKALSAVIVLLLLGLGFELYNPLIFPIVNWWEYDFRYRFDLEGYLCTDTFCHLVRLHDFRKGNCSIHTFGNFKVGDEFLFHYKIKENALSLEGQVVSIRKNSLGRGSHLGVIFKKGEKRDLLQKFWKSLKLHKKELKKRK
ncbi:MAG: hypothetical protein CME61_04170 [Halobacteriovoraceae bacterium]|nr:hypothetical protein [Halobacteriovoraceae bacterium]